MKRNLLIAFLIASFSTGISGQDRIITLNNDTIECRINKVTRSEIYFDITTQGVKTTGRMPITDVSSYSVSPASGGEPFYRNVSSGSAGRLRIGLNGGMGYIISSSEEAEESMVSMGVADETARTYYGDLKSGWYGSADATWIFRQRYGAGFKYKFFNTESGFESYFDPGDGYNLFYSAYKENIFVNFAGVSLFYIEPLGKSGKFSLYSAYSMGLAFYRNELEVFYGNFLITGNAPGLDGSIGLEYHITPAISAGAELSLFTATIRKIKITDGETSETVDLEKENYENLSRVEASMGVRFYFGNR
ncbi:MAG: hypothetical protein WAV93_09850 [Bacteroidales bacterium]